MSEPTSLRKLQILNSVDQFCKQYGSDLNPIRTQILIEALKELDDREEVLKSLNDKDRKKVKKLFEIDLNTSELTEELREKIANRMQDQIQSQWSKNSFSILKRIVPIVILIGVLYGAGKYLFFPDYWRASYFSNRELSGTPFGVYYERNISHDWGVGAPKKGMSSNNFSVRFESELIMLEKDFLTFKTISDDGIRLYIDDELILDFWRPQDSVPHQANKELESGRHSIRIEYFEAENGAKLNFEIESTKEGSFKLSSPN